MSLSSYPNMSKENKHTYNFMLGISTGWEQAGEWMLNKAGEEFRNGYDDRADLLRELGKAAKQKSSEKRDELDEWAEENSGN